MARIGLISCVSKKRPKPTEAKNLYDSALFLKSRAFVEQCCDSWFILSAKYGLVEPTDIIAPYEETLNKKSRRERDEWAIRVWDALCKRLKPNDLVMMLAGERYRESLIPLIAKHGCQVEVPMSGLAIGQQLHWLSNQQSQPSRQRDIERLYTTLRRLEDELGGKRLLSECTGKDDWPISGVYFFFEPGESRSGRTEPRVVRVGTHRVSKGSKTTLWNRLHAHRGTNGGAGNHRGSIFRKHVGAAMQKANLHTTVASWGLGQSAGAAVREGEQELERKVSKRIGSMTLLWLAIEDEAGPFSDRAYIERNLIGLLNGESNPADPPSPKWLGRFSLDDRIRRSGLWNHDHVGYRYSPEFLDVLDKYVLITTGKRSRPAGPIAPQGWYDK